MTKKAKPYVTLNNCKRCKLLLLDPNQKEHATEAECIRDLRRMIDCIEDIAGDYMKQFGRLYDATEKERLLQNPNAVDNLKDLTDWIIAEHKYMEWWHKACTRIFNKATKEWQEAKGKTNCLPDFEKLVNWLVSERRRLLKKH